MNGNGLNSFSQKYQIQKKTPKVLETKPLPSPHKIEIPSQLCNDFFIQDVPITPSIHIHKNAWRISSSIVSQSKPIPYGIEFESQMKTPLCRNVKEYPLVCGVFSAKNTKMVDALSSCSVQYPSDRVSQSHVSIIRIKSTEIQSKAWVSCFNPIKSFIQSFTKFFN